MMKRFKAWQPYHLFILLLSVSLLAGCADGVNTGHWLPRDTTAPTVTSAVPANDDTGVPINTRITAIFSEAMDPATININTFTVTGPEDTAVQGSVTPSGVNAVFTPTSDLAVNTTYTATITTGSKDLAGNALASNFVWIFTTGVSGDITAPTLISTFPLDNGTGLPINSASTATFSEPMDPTTLASPATSFTLKEFVGDNSVAGVVTYSGYTATFTPDNVLKPLTKYTSTVTTVATDLAGNALVSGLISNLWSWTTGAAPDTIAPTVTITSPVDNAINVPVDQKINATFSEQMKQATMITANFTVRKTSDNTSGNLQGTVSYDFQDNTATFSPQQGLADNTNYTVTITTGAQDLAGNALVPGLVPNPWTFRTAVAVVPPDNNSINLGRATTFGIAATAGVTNTPTAPITHINGNVVLDPLAQCNAVDVDAAGGFGLCGSNSSTPIINGMVISHFFSTGVPPSAIRADLLAAFLSITPPAGPPAAGSLGGATNIPAGTTLGAPTGNALVEGDNLFTPGVYQSLTSILITDDLTLDAQDDPNARFVFQSSSTVGTADGSIGTHPRILLINGAKASNVWWQAGSDVTLGTNSEFQGNILASRNITMKTSATSCGRLLAGAFTDGAFVFDSNVVSVPGHTDAPAGCE